MDTENNITKECKINFNRQSPIEPCKLFVTRVDRDLSTSKLKDLFSHSKIGTPISVYKKECDADKLFTYALIEYSSRREALEAIKHLNCVAPYNLSVVIAETQEEKAVRKKKMEGIDKMIVSASNGFLSSICAFCSKEALNNCLQCGESYCSRDCQVSHWPAHKKECLARRNKLNLPVPVKSRKISSPIQTVNKNNIPNGDNSSTEYFRQTVPLKKSGSKKQPVGSETTGKSKKSPQKCSQIKTNTKKDIGLPVNNIPNPLVSKVYSNGPAIPAKEISAQHASPNTHNNEKKIQKPANQNGMGVRCSEDSYKNIDASSIYIPYASLSQGLTEIQIIELTSPSSITITPIDFEVIIENIAEKMVNLKNIPPSDIVCDLFCVVKIPSGDYVRAKVVTKSLAEVSVLLLDVGKHIDVSVNDCFWMTDALYKYPILAIPAKIHGIKPVGSAWTKEALDNFQQLIDGITLFASVQGICEDNVLSVQLYDAFDLESAHEIGDLMQKLGKAEEFYCKLSKSIHKLSGIKKIQNSETSSAASSSLQSCSRELIPDFDCSKMISLGDEIKFTLVYETEDTYWILCVAQNPELLQSITYLASPDFIENCSGQMNLSKLPQNKFVAAYSPSAEEWYRAYVLDPNKREVMYIDYGNTEVVSRVVLLDEQYSFPPLVWKCRLCDLNQESRCLLDSSKFDAQIAELVKMDDSRIKLKSGPVTFTLTIWSKDLVLADSFNHETLSNSPSILKVENLPPPKEISVLSTVKLIFSAKPSLCVVHLVEDEEELFNMNKLVEKYHDIVSPQPYLPVKDEIVACMYEDGCWYRGRVISVIKSEVIVHYIDYGNTITVPFNKIQKLHPSLALRIFGIEVVLDGLAPSSIPPTFNKMVKEYYDKIYTMKIIRKDKKPIVQLYNDSVDLSKVFERACCISPHSSSSIPVTMFCDIPKPNMMIGDDLNLKIKHIFNECMILSCLNVEMESNTMHIIKQVQQYCSNATNDISIQPEIQQACIAWCAENKRWERACLLSIGDHTGYYFIDSGQFSLKSSRVLPFPEKLASIPYYSILAYLEDWTEPFNDIELEGLYSNQSKVHESTVIGFSQDKLPILKLRQ